MKYLRTLLAALTVAALTAPALGQTSPKPVTVAVTTPATAPDCATFYMGSGGKAFSRPLESRMAQFKKKYPKADVALYHYWSGRSLARCKNPVYVGHSMGAFAAIAQANADKKGRVVSIDPPSWKAGSELRGGTGTVSRQPTDHLFQCTAQFGCGRVTGPNVVKKNLTSRRLGHVPLPYAPEVGAAILK